MSYFANSLAFARHILDDQPVQIISTAAMLAILWVLFAGDGALLARARDVQGLGVFVLLPFGFKVTFIYFLLYVVCTTYGATPPLPSQSPDPEYRAMLPETDPDDYWAPPPPTRSMSSLRPHTIQLPVRGWSIDVKFSLESPHVVFEKYHFIFSKQLDKNLAVLGRSGTVRTEYIINPTCIGDPDALYDSWCAKLKVIHERDRAISVYEFALTPVSISLPLEKIPVQFRNLKGGAGGNGWLIKVPNLTDLHTFLDKKGTLHPIRQTVNIPQGFPYFQNINQLCVDLPQAKIPIIVPILKAISFGCDSLYGPGVGQSPFFGDTKRFDWDRLTYVFLDSVQIFARDYRAILEASPGLKTMIINRPGEEYGVFELQEPARVVKADQLETLHLTGCQVDVRSYLYDSVVDLPTVTELMILSCRDTNQFLRADEVGVKWAGIHTLILSDTLEREFIHDCQTRLPSRSTLDIISM
ncbi:hypothetical protein GGU11DRAFT_144828 [Lentinula aff. detonsa]|nr:hypothetical protein GGU11DRAFT_144828 [Lentinula aff. detonsa]